MENKEGITVLSLFDGMSCGQIALQKLGIKVKAYYASEIDKYAIKVTQKNFPNTIQLGDVTKVSAKDLPQIDLLIGGSPCQGFSFAGKMLAFDDPRSGLFFEFVRLKNECQPKYFMLENVKMAKEHKRVINEYLGVKPIMINSALVSAQNRERLYWTNIYNEPHGLFGDMVCKIPQPADRGILLRDILETNVDDRYYLSDKYLSYLVKRDENYAAPNIRSLDGKASCITVSNESKMGSDMNLIIQLNQSKESGGKQPYQQNRVYDINGLAPALMAQLSTGSNAILELSGRIRRLTPTEAERLQTVPDCYTEGVSDTQRYRMLGNGWTVDVIAHIFSYMNF